jgi:hypothetical protein
VLRAMLDRMDTTDLLIIVTAAGPIAASLFAPGFTSALLTLAKARTQRVKHVPVSGADIYHRGVPLDEAQFRDAFAAMQAELDELGPHAERNQWQLKQGYAAINRLSMLTGTFPQAFPIRSNADNAWQWYADNNSYVISDLPQRHGWRLLAPGTITAVR